MNSYFNRKINEVFLKTLPDIQLITLLTFYLTILLQIHIQFTMAAKICVPCNFDIRNLHDPFHGNVDVEFNDDSKMKVNSLILSWNSDTFCYFFNVIRLTNVEIKDFSKDAVIVFLESMYCGNVNLTKGLFRDIYKLSVVFKAMWITDRCRKFFARSVNNNLKSLKISSLFSTRLYTLKLS